MRLAYFSPLNPVKSGISDYSEELLPQLAKHAKIDVFVDGYMPVNDEIKREFDVFDIADFEAIREERRYDTQIYQMGNSPAHTRIYGVLQRHPGIVVLHDYVLHHFVGANTIEQGNLSAYIREMGFSHGLNGVRAVVRGQVYGVHPGIEFAVNGRAIEASLGVIVHNNYTRAKIIAERQWVNVTKVNHHAFPLMLPDTSSAKNILSLEDSELVLGSFGLVTPEKRLEKALRAFRRLKMETPSATFLVVGEVPDWYPLGSIIDELGLHGSVRLVGRVEMYMFQLYMAAADICVNLRYPTMGETSGSLLRILGAGRPAIVSNIGWYAELPDSCCSKIPVDESEEETLFATILRLARDRSELERMGAAARKYVELEHNIAKSAQEYMTFIENVLAG